MIWIIRKKETGFGKYCDCLDNVEFVDRPSRHTHFFYGFSLGFIGITYCKWYGRDPKLRIWFRVRINFGWSNEK